MLFEFYHHELSNGQLGRTDMLLKTIKFFCRSYYIDSGFLPLDVVFIRSNKGGSHLCICCKTCCKIVMSIVTNNYLFSDITPMSLKFFAVVHVYIFCYSGFLVGTEVPS